METSQPDPKASRKTTRRKRVAAEEANAQPVAIKRRVPGSTRKATLYPFEQTLTLLTRLAQDRGRERDSDLARQALSIGSLFVAIQGGLGSDGLYGGVFSPAEVAAHIRGYVVIGADWLALQGQPITVGGGSLAALLELLAKSQGEIAARPGEAFAPGYTPEQLAGAEDIVLSAEMGEGLGEEDLTPL
jgi:hypothetical protein